LRLDATPNQQPVIRTSQRPKRHSENVPPGQVITEKFPVLHAGFVPPIRLDKWQFRLFGLVEHPVQWTWEQFLALPSAQVRADFHCVTGWSRQNNLWEGVPFYQLRRRVKLDPEVQYVMVHCYGGYETNLPLRAMLEDDVLFAYRVDGEPLTEEHGGPLRLVVPQRYGWKSAKWVSGLEFLAADKQGFWESRGYHDNGDPWKEERFRD
jgi:DMSO/TMAO reductase YedYZ molybdopterin-dependent catalytic subunit